MTVTELKEKLDLKQLAAGDENAKVKGGFVCDLLSWVMGHGVEGGAWITVQAHMNILAVASLLDMACIIIPEGIAVAADVLEKAQEENITIFSSKQSAYALAGQMYALGIGVRDEI